MARKLNTFVTAHERNDKGELTGQSGTFGPNDELPVWAEKAITNPHVWEDVADEPVVNQPDGPAAPVVVKPGSNDSREKWVAYARTKKAPEHELVALDEGGLTRDKLREKYGA